MPLLLELENLFLMDEGKYDEAIANYQTLRSNFDHDPMLHQHALFGLGYVYSIAKEEQKTGLSFFEELQSLYPESSMAESAREISKSYGFDLAELESEDSNKEVSVSNFPNPFNPTTQISFILPEQAFVKLRVFDLIGREVAELVNGELKAGNHNANFNASNLASGIYLYQLEIGDKIITQKMTLIK